jgi:hypothetical protein
VDIPAGGTQPFVLAYTPSAGTQGDGMTMVNRYRCMNADGVVSLEGINTVLLSFAPTPVADMIAVGVTLPNDGYAHIPGPGGTGLFVIAATNIGVATQLTARVRLYDSAMPLSVNICETNPDSSCKSTPSPSVTRTINKNENTTWTAFLTANGAIVRDAARFRVAFEFIDSSSIVRGSTSTAVTTQ